MKKIFFFSSSRADLAFLYSIFKIFNSKKKNFIRIILNDDSNIDYKFLEKKKIIKVKSGKIDTNKNNLIIYISNLLKIYNKLLSINKPDYLFIVGDRYEAFVMAFVCNFLNIKIFHIAGGDVSNGSYDEEMRTFISKSAYLHFPTNIQSKKNLKFLVSDKNKIFNYGSPSLDYINKIIRLDKTKISKLLNINFNKYNILVTFHPETKHLKQTIKNLNTLIFSLVSLGEKYNFFFTGCNNDTFGQKFNKIILKNVKKRKNFYFFSNLGTEKYIQLAQNCDIVLGNSSSLIYEIPFIGIKSLLLGKRQDGRYMSKKIVKTKITKDLITKKIKLNIKKKINRDLKTYGNGSASKKIFENINILINE